MKVIIYSLVDVFYYSFYIEGFYRLYGKKNVTFSCKNFPGFPERTFAAIVKGEKECKIAIDAFDSPRINMALLGWCDIYGKVNKIATELEKEKQEKILTIGPSFGIKIWSALETVTLAIHNWSISKSRIRMTRNFFASYWRQYKRLALDNYNLPSEPVGNYVYFISSLWRKEEKTNSYRHVFISACKESNDVRFEGGFAPRPDINEMGYEGAVSDRISPKEYISRINNSFVVFNTPAVENCHGWKLGEYLSLGKAIISTRHANLLPEPLVHGEHIHYVSESKEEMKKAINKILKEPEYRRRLERKSREYYIRNLAPETVVKKMVESCG